MPVIPVTPVIPVIPGADFLLLDLASFDGTWPGIFAQVRDNGLRVDSLHLHVDHWTLHAALPQLDDTKDTKDV